MRRTKITAMLCACVIAVGARVGSGQSPRDSGLLIRNVTLISPERRAPLEHADVLVRNGRVVAVGQKLATTASARTIDGTGKFLIPGLIDSHVHVGHSAALDDDAIDAHPDL